MQEQQNELETEHLAAHIDALIGNEGGSDFMKGMKQQLAAIDALPAAVYLFDEDEEILYCSALVEEEQGTIDAPDEVALDVLHEKRPGDYILFYRKEVVGLLRCAGSAQTHVMNQFAAVLGPALVAIQSHELIGSELRHMHERVNLLLEAGQLLRELDVDVLLVRILETMIRTVQAQVGAVFSVDADGGLQIRNAWGIQEAHADAILMQDGRRLVDVVFEQRIVHYYDSESITSDLDTSQLHAHLDAVLVMPLMTGDRCNGVVLVANPEDEFDSDTQQFGTAVCDMAAIALDNAVLVKSRLEKERLQSEMELATTVQMNMFPEAALDVEGLRINGDSKPCDETGGDYYTFLEQDSHVYAMIADVSGHGLGAALYTTMAHAVLQQQLHNGVDIVDCCNAVSQALGYSKSERFMTAALLDFNREEKTFRYVSAGHNPLLLIPASGDIQWLDSTGMPMGIMPDIPCEEAEEAVPFHSGDCIILYTDGFPEAMNADGVVYEEERMVEALCTAVRAGKDSRQIMDALYDDIDGFMKDEPFLDDLTLVVVICE